MAASKQAHLEFDGQFVLSKDTVNGLIESWVIRSLIRAFASEHKTQITEDPISLKKTA